MDSRGFVRFPRQGSCPTGASSGAKPGGIPKMLATDQRFLLGDDDKYPRHSNPSRERIAMLGSDRPVFRTRPAVSPPNGPLMLSAEQAQAVRKFVAQLGGFDQARRALAMLAMLSGQPSDGSR